MGWIKNLQGIHFGTRVTKRKSLLEGKAFCWELERYLNLLSNLFLNLNHNQLY